MARKPLRAGEVRFCPSNGASAGYSVGYAVGPSRFTPADGMTDAVQLNEALAIVERVRAVLEGTAILRDQYVNNTWHDRTMLARYGEACAMAAALSLILEPSAEKRATMPDNEWLRETKEEK